MKAASGTKLPRAGTSLETSEVLIRTRYNYECPPGVISRRIKYIRKEISELALALAKISTQCIRKRQKPGS